jgi:hypothetical protein
MVDNTAFGHTGDGLADQRAGVLGDRQGLPDRPISTVGEESSHIRRTLNPLFVESLMGWPPGWTSLTSRRPHRTPPALGEWSRTSSSSVCDLHSLHSACRKRLRRRS